MDTSKNPKAIVAANLAFIGASKSNTEYLIARKRQMEITQRMQGNKSNNSMHRPIKQLWHKCVLNNSRQP